MHIHLVLLENMGFWWVLSKSLEMISDVRAENIVMNRNVEISWSIY